MSQVDHTHAGVTSVNKGSKVIQDAAAHGRRPLREQLVYAFFAGMTWMWLHGGLVMPLFYLGAYKAGFSDPWRATCWFCVPSLLLLWFSKTTRTFFERRRNASNAEKILAIQRLLQK